MSFMHALSSALQVAAPVLLAAGLCVSGCQSTSHNTSSPQRATAPEKLNPFPIVGVRQVLSGDKVLGYIKQRIDINQPSGLRAQLVYDSNFSLVGFFLDSGSTYRFSTNGRAQSLGARDRTDSLRVLLETQVDTELIIADMSPPKTIY